MHGKDYEDSGGTFSEPEAKRYTCRCCSMETATCRTWESSCEGYEDYKYTCQDPDCGYVWWIEGADA